MERRECSATYEGVTQAGGTCRLCSRPADVHRRETEADWAIKTSMGAPLQAGATEGYESPARRAKIAMVLLAAVIAVDLAAILSDLAELQLLDRAASPPGITTAEADANDLRQGAFGLVQLLLFAVTGGFFIAWLHRVYRNSIAFGEPHPRYGVGWTIGGWFVPIWNLWRPKQLVNDVWRSTEPRAASGRRRLWVPVVLAIWWGAWIVDTILSQIAFVVSEEASSLEALRTASQVSVAADSFDAVTAALALVVVFLLTRAQEARAERIRVAPKPDERPIGDAWAVPADV